MDEASGRRRSCRALSARSCPDEAVLDESSGAPGQPAAGLAELEGTVQLNLKVGTTRTRSCARSSRATRRSRGSGSRRAARDGVYGQRLELGERVAAAVGAPGGRRGARARALVAEALDVADEPDEELVLRAAFLVAREARSLRRRSRTRGAAEQERLRFEVIGPLPPTAFVELELGAMGLLTGLLTLPLAPVRGTVWIAERLLEEAERELSDPAWSSSAARGRGAIRAGRDLGGRVRADRGRAPETL